MPEIFSLSLSPSFASVRIHTRRENDENCGVIGIDKEISAFFQIYAFAMTTG